MKKDSYSYMELLNDFRKGLMIKSLVSGKSYKFHKDMKIICYLEGLCFYPQYSGITKEELRGQWIKLNKVW